MKTSEYISMLVECGRKRAFLSSKAKLNECMTDIERTELAGHLLQDEIIDAEKDICVTVLEIMESKNYSLVEKIAAYCRHDSAENGYDLLCELKMIIADHYEDKMQSCLDDAHKELDDNKHIDAGHKRVIDPQTGEPRWVK